MVSFVFWSWLNGQWSSKRWLLLLTTLELDHRVRGWTYRQLDSEVNTTDCTMSVPTGSQGSKGHNNTPGTKVLDISTWKTCLLMPWMLSTGIECWGEVQDGTSDRLRTVRRLVTFRLSLYGGRWFPAMCYRMVQMRFGIWLLIVGVCCLVQARSVMSWYISWNCGLSTTQQLAVVDIEPLTSVLVY